MSKKFIYAVIISTLLLVNYSNANGMSDDLKVTGRVMNLKVLEENEKTILLKVFLDLKFTNEGTKSVILYWHDFWINSISLFKTDEKRNEDFLYSNGGLPSNSTSSHWLTLQRNLNQATPPLETTKTIDVKESVSWQTEVGLIFYKKKQSYLPNESWKEILNNSPVFLTVELEMFPKAISKSMEDNDFGKTLQKKWSNLGLLQLEDIQSEPVLLDLNPANAVNLQH